MNQHQKLAYYFILALCSSSFIALLSVLLFFLCRNHSHRQLSDESPPPPAKPSARPHTLIDIYTATEGFTHRRVIGEGRLGTVYAALSETGELIAVKRIYPWLVLSNNNAGFGFSSVIKSLSSAQHPNLVSITGYSEAPGERIIVMEYAGAVNLDMYLHQNPDGAFLLNWKHRVKIAAGAARGLQYLHESMAPSVIHGCVKPSNILIDAEFIPKLSDYGLNYLAAREKRGLVGYVDDEYWKGKSGQGNCKENDVYGYGVVLLELLSGRGCEEGWLVKWALPLIKEMRFSEVLDPRIEYPSDLKPLMRMGKVALACVGNCRKSRPVIGQVVAILNNLETQVCI
ncbi:PTI1-like tyrosine-protein kinase [Cucumis melo var. makuwa]|uniref:PTI1-like tyrosine-protein kinase n=1 Tax=Cucumis melo var. makuwa TaxID=1194695 RepID=A0A5D3CQ63_CUCMM|nr:PTI1-like tyrosine-protein kinase [Cucumis melo var. makuwa]TYK13164.1 PTI1-like tyrosine-protein kinase [Cucumis melo var. makuwa]